MDSSLRISSGAVSDRGLSEKRPQNEDSYLEMGQCGIYAVADGVGGAQAGEVASQMAMEILGEAFTNLHEGDDPETVMRTAIERANTAIHQMAHELAQLSSMATTVVALHLTGNIATIGHVGDSRLYRVDHDGDLYRETEDHSMVGEEVRAGRMTEEQAENHPSRNIINRALGAEPTIEVDLKTILVDPGTSFLICSDGVTRHVSDQEIKGVLTFGGEPGEVCEYLKDLCYERGAEDNLTAVVIKVAAAEGSINETAPLEIFDVEEPTIATARSSNKSKPADEDDELLELEAYELPKPDTDLEFLEESQSDASTIPTVRDESSAETESESESDMATLAGTELPRTFQADQLSSTEDSESSAADEKKPGLLVKVASSVALILLGAVLGLGVYQFAFLPKQEDISEPRLTEMQSSNQPLSAFEENRRLVDKSPAEALARFGVDPRDAEDYFLVGRANLLMGHYPEAKKAFTEARNHIAAGDVDKNNAKTLETEIVIAMAVMNDSTVQSILKSGLDASKPAANSNVNAVKTNVNR